MPQYHQQFSITKKSHIFSVRVNVHQFTYYFDQFLLSISYHNSKSYSLFVQFDTQMNAILFLCFALSSCIFLPERLRIVDSNPQQNNFLVRGNLPIDHKRFQIQQLKGNLTQITGLKEYRLIVYSFINYLTAKQTKNRYIEEKFFKKNKKEGQYRHKLILGSLTYPHAYAQWLSNLVLSLGLGNSDSMSEFVEELREEMTLGKNTIIYIHCSAGFDRTGFVAGAYKMTYLGKSLQQVMDENMSIIRPKRNHMHFNAFNGLNWYCMSLKKREKCIWNDN